MKPRTIWIITALCLALLGGAMAWITRSMLHMEGERVRMENESAVQEMARLSLWRMEGVAWNVVITESARPPEHYRALSTPQALLNNGTFTNVNAGEVVAISPLLTEPSEFCKLYFEMDGQGKLRSPQVPEGPELLACQNAHAVPPQVIADNAVNFSEFNSRILRNDHSAQLKELRERLKVPSNLTANQALVWSAAWGPDPAAPADSRSESEAPRAAPAAPPAAPAPAPDPSPRQASIDAGAASPNQEAPRAQSYAMQQRAVKPDQIQAQQSAINGEEAKARQDFVASSLSKVVNRRSMNYENVAPAAEAWKGGVDKALSARKEGVAMSKDGVAGSQKSEVASAAAPFRSVTKSPAIAASALPEAAPVREMPAPAATAAPAAASPASMPRIPETKSASQPPAISDFRPLWLGDALLLTRQVSTPDRQWIQGAWLDWDKLRGELLNAVKDRFPNADVVKAPDNPEPGAHLLAALPVQLIPGLVDFPAAPFWSPLKVSLSIAWLCVLLAVAAVALVLRGMMALSERRASFVSSVTHELRTPLATFKLYSEMLADGMVKEEAKKQQYLETLTGEADRLGHLVENVLAYSRIERGKGPAAAAGLRAGDLVNRIEPRLNQRTLIAGMDFGVISDPAALAAELRTDAGAVEQILCNLVDNACKYGRRDDGPGKVELVVSRERRRLCLAVRDYGPGIPRAEQNTVFLPFHKSARDAAHSAPGVGLGLALCRRLAGELRGTLEIDRSWKQGACFVLKLPV